MLQRLCSDGQPSGGTSVYRVIGFWQASHTIRPSLSIVLSAQPRPTGRVGNPNGY